MEKILIGYLNDGRRFKHFELMCRFLSNAKNKDIFHILLLCSRHEDISILSIVEKYKLSYSIAPAQTEYMSKIAYFVQYAKVNNYKYCMKMDNDIILPSFIFDFVVDSLSQLDELDIGILLPSLVTSIPSAEYIIEDFFDEGERKKIYSFFESFRYSNEYLHLNANYPTPWSLEKYFQMVESLKQPHNGVYKAIHPIRYNTNATREMNRIVLTKKNHFFTQLKEPYLYIAPQKPYFMPQCFVMKLDLLEKVLDPSLAYDIYDEVTLNNLIRRENKNVGFIRNCLGIHIAHNGFMQNFMEYEETILSLFFQDLDATLE